MMLSLTLIHLFYTFEALTHATFGYDLMSTLLVVHYLPVSLCRALVKLKDHRDHFQDNKLSVVLNRYAVRKVLQHHEPKPKALLLHLSVLTQQELSPHALYHQQPW